MLLNGDKVGPYTIRESVGQGGMATVYKAWHEGLHRFEALKVPRNASGGDPDSAYVQRLLAEARTAAALHHPNIVAIHGISEPLAPIPFFAMDWVEGRDLAKILAEKRDFSIGETIQILESVASALDYAHERGVVHRDIKPANILIGENNGIFVPRVVDFGISRAAEDEDGEGATKLTKSGMIVGTPEYMSPEQAGSGEVVDYRTDIYSLAVVAYEMLCGSPPFTAGSGVSRLSILISHVRDIAPLFEKCPNFPKAAGEVILRALSKSPQDRPQSCAAFLAEFKAALSATDWDYIVGRAGSSAFKADERTPFDSSRFEPVDGATLFEMPATPVGAPPTITPPKSAPETAVERPTGSSSNYSLRARLAAAATATPPPTPASPPTQAAVPTPLVADPPAPPLRESVSVPAVAAPVAVAAPPIEPAPSLRTLPITPIVEPKRQSSSRLALFAGFGGILVGAAIVFALSGRVAPNKISAETPAVAAPSTASPKIVVEEPEVETPVAATPRLRTVRQTRSRAIEYSTITRRSDSRPLGSTYILQRGQIGMRQVVLAVTYQGEKEMARKVESDRVIKAPVPQIVVLGTRTIAPRPIQVKEPEAPSRPRIRRISRPTSNDAPRPRAVRRVERTVRKAPPRVVARPKARPRPAAPRRHVREAPLPP